MILKLFYPELFLSFAILIQLLLNSRLVNNLVYNFPVLNKEIFFQTFFILFCLLILLFNLNIENFFSIFTFIVDENSRCSKIFFVIISLIVLIFIEKGFTLQKLNFFEFYIIFLLSVLSSLLLINSYDLLTIYLLIEMQALCFYILTSFKRNSAFSSEAGLKYFVFGSLISCIFLLGLSVLYGLVGTLNLHHLSMLTVFGFPGYMSDLYTFSIFLITITFLFKLGVVPFHFWVPDVYEGAPLSSTIIFSILSKFIIFTVFVKWILVLNNSFSLIENLLVFTGLLSVFIGTFLSLKQKRFKRLLIYSSIAQIGFLILTIAVNNYESLVYGYFFLTIYIITSILIWGHFVYLNIFKSKVNHFFQKSETSIFISDLTNYFKVNPLWTLSFLFIFFSVAGIPPLSGFLAKVLILVELVYSNYLLTSILLILISSISIFYYIRVIKITFFEPILNKTVISKELQNVFMQSGLNFSSLIFTTFIFLLIFIFFFPNILLLSCQYFVLNFFAF